MQPLDLIRRFIFGLPKGKLFTRRELLEFGATEGSVDQEIRRLIGLDVIVRMAWGVFVRPNASQPLPSIAEVVYVKIRAFGRKQIVATKDVAKEHGLTPKGEEEIVYETDGATSSFRVLHKHGNHTVVRPRKHAARKLCLGYRKARRAIKALWCLGKKNVRELELSKATALFDRTDRELFWNSLRWMPGWLSDFVIGVHNPTRSRNGYKIPSNVQRRFKRATK